MTHTQLERGRGEAGSEKVFEHDPKGPSCGRPVHQRNFDGDGARCVVEEPTVPDVRAKVM